MYQSNELILVDHLDEELFGCAISRNLFCRFISLHFISFQSLSTIERYISEEYILYVAIFFRIKNILLEDTKN